jgi:hypothetical protein
MLILMHTRGVSALNTNVVKLYALFSVFFFFYQKKVSFILQLIISNI